MKLSDVKLSKSEIRKYETLVTKLLDAARNYHCYCLRVHNTFALDYSDMALKASENAHALCMRIKEQSEQSEYEWEDEGYP